MNASKLLLSLLPPAAPRNITFLDPVYLGANDTIQNDDYYWVNSSTGTEVISSAVSTDGTWLISVSSSVNNNANASGLNLYAWGEQTMTGWVTKCKLSDASSIAFREGAIPNLVTQIQLHDWLVYPNPATTGLTVNNPMTNADSYAVTDMLGRTVLQGSIQADTQTIDINGLVPGSYIINMYKDGVRAYNTVFVKQ